MPNFKDIPKFTSWGNYSVHYDWPSIEDWIARQTKNFGEENMQLNPDFQRGHVWTEEKQKRYVEYVLRGGQSSKMIYFNCNGWQGDFKGPMILVDGKQRLEAVRKFMRNELAIFEGYYLKDYTGYIGSDANFYIHVNNLKTRKEVLQWYLDLNEGGVVHTADELNKVRELLQKE